MDVVEIPLERLIPYARNPRRNEDAIATVAASLAELDWRQPIVVDADMVILARHTRLEAAKRLGLTSAPVHVARGPTPAQARAYRLMDNRAHGNAAWDEALLGLEFCELMEEAFDLKLTGFEDGKLDRLLAAALAEDEQLKHSELLAALNPELKRSRQPPHPEWRKTSQPRLVLQPQGMERAAPVRTGSPR